MTTTKNNYIADIDGMRALAVVAVIINHFNESIMPSGFLGVDIFFVISGYVITASLVNRGIQSASSFFIGFYQRRIKRLLPALLFCFILGGILFSSISPYPDQHLKTGLFALIGFSNVELYLNAVDYWGQDAKLNPFTHTWSLGVEEQFYFIFPLILWVFTKGCWQTNLLNRVIWALFILSICSLYFFIDFSSSHPSATYFLMPFRFWEIGLGCLLYLKLNSSLQPIQKWMEKVPTQIIILVIVGILFMPREHATLATILIVLSTLIMLAKLTCDAVSQSSYKTVLSHPGSLYLGKISYSLYLWHWIVIVIAKWTWGLTVWTVPFWIAMMFIFAMISFHIVEKPLRHHSWKTSKKAQLFLGIMLTITAFAIINQKTLINPFYLGEDQAKIAKVHRFQIKDLPCQNISENDSAQTIRTIGNSHANHILPMLRVISQKCGLKLMFEKPSEFIIMPSGNNIHKNKLDEVLADLNSGDILILSSRDRYLYSRPYLNSIGDYWHDHSKVKEKRGFGLKLWLEELDEVIEKAELKNINIVHFLPFIEFDQPLINYNNMCGEAWFRVESEGCNPKVSKDFLSQRFPQAYFEEIEQRDNENDNFFVFNPEPIFCSSEQTQCERVVNGGNVYFDTNHLTIYGATMLTEPFTSFLVENKLIDSLDNQ